MILCCRDETVPGCDTVHHYSFVPLKLKTYGCSVIADIRLTDTERDRLVRKLERRGKLEDGAIYKLSELQKL